MKKALIALAVLGAASGAAMAQSSVTLYGVADIAVGKAASGGDSKWGAQTNTIVTNGTSRIGLTGKEDLGGGLWAGFKYESPVNLANGATSPGVGGPTLTNGAWGREANVMLGSNAVGTVKLGRSVTPAFNGQGTYELTGFANYSVVANTFGWGGYGQSRNDAQIDYRTPSLAGLSVELAYIPKADGALLPSGQNNTTDLWSGNIVYNQGPIKAALTASKLGKTAAGGNANKTNWTLGGSYTINNMIAVSASYNRTYMAQKWYTSSGAANTCNNNVYLCGATMTPGARRFGWELGASFFQGPFTVSLDLTRDTKNDLYLGKKYTNGVVEGKYALSKRTFLYADYLRLDSQNNYGVGVRHNF